MKRILYLGLVAVLASCSSQKYAAQFSPSHSGYGYGELVTHEVKKATPPAQTAVQAPAGIMQAEQASTAPLVASTSKDAAVISQPAPPATVITNEQIEQVRKNYQALSKSQKKEFRKELKAEVKRYISNRKNGKEETVTAVKKTQAGIDHDLRLAIIFGVIGLVALLIPGYAFTVIGGIALIIGAVFFVMWIIRQ